MARNGRPSTRYSVTQKAPGVYRRDALERFGSREEIRGQIVNTDIDGLLTGALLWETKGWPLWGFYDTQNLWINEAARAALRSTPGAIVWVDVDMCWPRTRSISQHVILDGAADLDAVHAFKTTCNPNLVVEPTRTRTQQYRLKYPFGTFQWVWWLARLPQPDPEDRVATGLLWMPDGGFESIQPDRHRANCLDWATEILADGPLKPLIDAGRDDEALLLVAEAEAWVVDRCPASSGKWINHQYQMASIRRGAAQVATDPSAPAGAAEVDLLLAAIAEAFGWPTALETPTDLERFSGTWRSSGCAPARWPASANDGGIVSVSIGTRSTWYYTLPDSSTSCPSLSEVLPAIT